LNIDKNSVPLLLVRLFAGFTMFFAGFEKAVYAYWGGHTAGWSPASSLTNGGGGILHGWFVGIAKAGWVGPLVFTGEMLIGIALLLGLTVRLASVFGIIENGLFWANAYMPLSVVNADGSRSVNSGVFGLGWSSGPLELNAAVIMMYICLIVVGGAGLKWSIAGYLNGKFEVVRKNKIVQLFVN